MTGDLYLLSRVLAESLGETLWITGWKLTICHRYPDYNEIAAVNNFIENLQKTVDIFSSNDTQGNFEQFVVQRIMHLSFQKKDVRFIDFRQLIRNTEPSGELSCTMLSYTSSSTAYAILHTIRVSEATDREISFKFVPVVTETTVNSLPSYE